MAAAPTRTVHRCAHWDERVMRVWVFLLIVAQTLLKRYSITHAALSSRAPGNGRCAGIMGL